MEGLLAYQKEILENLKKAEKNYKKTPKDRIKKPYIETRLENLEQLWIAFKDGHKAITAKATQKERQDTYFTEDIYEEFEEAYVSYKTSLKETLQTYLESSSGTSPENQKSRAGYVGSECDVKLPRVQLPTFSGKYVEWQTFYDMFHSLVHTNNNLTPVEKLYYLKSNLSGEPECLLRNFSTTNDNYEEAWKQLLKRYDNKRYNCNALLRLLFTQKPIMCESASAIRQLLDTTTTCLQSLRNMGISTERINDMFVIYLIVSKLDPESIRQWEYQLGLLCDELPTWTQLSDFLESKFRSLEMINANKVRPNTNTKPKSFHGSINDNNKSNYSNVTIKCNKCKREHYLYNCKEFIQLSVKDRQDYVQKNNLCFNCFSPSHPVIKCRNSGSCKRCGRRHHSLLHFEREVSGKSEDVPLQGESDKTMSTISTNFSSRGLEPSQPSQVLLATVSVWAHNDHGYKLRLRGLLDQGSQASFISESVVQLLGLSRKRVSGTVSGIGGGGHTNVKHMVSLRVVSRHDPEVSIQVKAYVLRSVTSLLPSTELYTPDWLHLDKIPLADPGYATPNKIDILLGAEVYSEILLDGIVRHNKILAQNTKLGWILSGTLSQNSTSAVNRIITMHMHLSGEELLKKFWEMENEPNLIQKRMTDTEKRCEEFYDRTTTRDEEGRFIVKLPFDKQDPECQYGKSVVIATKRYEFLEKRLQTNPYLNEEYQKVLQEYLTMNHMIPVKKEDINNPKAIYLPHHAVVREDKETTKVRVVFDGSCKGLNNFSLNDNLMVGPKLQQDLRHILMRWRNHRICMVADIVKMFRMVKVSSEDTDFQRIVWRPQIDQPLRHFKLLRVTFGTACAPYLAVKTLQRLADEEHKKFPTASTICKRDYYMDDLLTGCDTLPEAIHIYSEMNKLMNCGGFKLQKWNSNNQELLTHIGEDNNSNNDLLKLKTSIVMKVLGLKWHRNIDCFQYTLDLPDLNQPVTKRQVLSDVARLYDPLGWIAPVIITAKIFIQKLWKSKLDWDHVLTTDLISEWLQFRTSLTHLQQINIPRWYHFTPGSKVELHAFADASKVAYGAAVYIRVINNDNEICVSLVSAKSKVAPIEKEISIPRLELCGAVLAAKLLFEVSQIMNIQKEHLYAWSDSTIVLAWLRGGSSRWTTFVSNRVSEILNILDYERWRHVTTDSNPADCVSRGIATQDLLKHSLWWSGPSWLSQPTTEFDNSNNNYIEDTHEEERHTSLIVLPVLKEKFIWTMFSSLSKTLKAISYWRRVLQNLRLPKEKQKLYSRVITPAELNTSLVICIKQVQEENFSEEIEQLKMKKFVAKKSRLRTLCPIFDEDGVLRVGGRIEESEAIYNTKHPIVLPAKSHLTKLIISDAHIKTFHGGPQAMLCYLKTKYWILRAKEMVKSHYRACVKCLRHSKYKSNQLMGQIPEHRLKPTRPFKSSGCDYLGPISVRFSPGRGAKFYKGYICLFICLVTKAIHLKVNFNHNVVGLDRWRLTQKMVNNFWKRWYREYLVNLNQRYKWNTQKSEPEIGDIVILRDDNIPPAKWILGKITNKYLGPDNIARVVSVKCKNGEFKRPISKLCILPK